MAELKNQKKLKSLDVRACVKIGDAGLQILAVPTSLRSLKLRNPAVTMQGWTSGRS